MNPARQWRNDETLTSLLAHRARSDQHGFRILCKGKLTENYLSFAELYEDTRTIAAALSADITTHDRIAIMLPPGKQFVQAFYSCILAGGIAVPMYLPRRKSPETAAAICHDAMPSVILTNEKLKDKMTGFTSLLQLTPKVVTIESCADKRSPFVPVRQSPQDIAFLQYTSGSTATPKGVKITHRNVISNVTAIEQITAFQPGDSMGCWLPPYHDMGLVGGLLFPVVSNADITLVAPQYFVQHPELWMNLMSQFRCHISAGPNFAYQLCADSNPEHDIPDLDLSHIKTLVCGAEPVRIETLQKFYDRYKSAGLSWNALSPCYGLAESTLISTGKNPKRPLQTISIDPSSFEKQGKVIISNKNSSVTLTACGSPVQDLSIDVINPVSESICPEGEVGEICIRGSSVSSGYWNRHSSAPKRTDEQAGYTRTGDRGFFLNEQLFLCGRYKELVIVRGRNFDPTDLERCLSQHALPDKSICAIFTNHTNEEQLIVACELPRTANNKYSREYLETKIAGTLSSYHGITPTDIIFCIEFGLPRTSSGKLRRLTCSELFNESTLKQVSTSYFLPATTMSFEPLPNQEFRQ